MAPGCPAGPGSGRVRGGGRRPGGPPGPPGPGRGPRGGGWFISGGDASSTSSLVCGAGAFDQADRRQGDVDQVEFVGERLDDPSEAIEVVADERLAQVGSQDLRAPLAQVGDGRQVGDLELRPGRVLDVAELAVFARLDERDGGAFAAGSPGPADAMDVLIGVRRDVVVDDVRDVVDVQPASRDVGRDEDVQGAVAEAAHHPVAALLGEAAVERAGVVTSGAQRLREIVDFAAGPSEDERRGRVLHVQDPAQGGQLVVAPDDVRDLADAGRAVARRPPRHGRSPGRARAGAAWRSA